MESGRIAGALVDASVALEGRFGALYEQISVLAFFAIGGPVWLLRSLGLSVQMQPASSVSSAFALADVVNAAVLTGATVAVPVLAAVLVADLAFALLGTASISRVRLLVVVGAVAITLLGAAFSLTPSGLTT